MTDDRGLIRRYVENRDQLSEEELESLVALLRARPELAVELKDQLIVDELLAQKFDLSRWHFLPQVDQRLRDERDGFPGIQASDLAQRTSPEGSTSPAGMPRSSKSLRRSRWPRVVAAAVLVAVLGSSGLWIYAGQRRVGTIESTAGDVEIVRHDQRRAASNGGAIRFEDRLITSANSNASIRFQDGTALKIDADATAAFHAPSATVPGKRVFVEQGRISADVVPQPMGKPMTFESATGTAEVQGTSLQFHVASQETHVTVTEGEVKVSHNANQESVVVTKNQFAVITEGSLASAPTGWPSDRKGLIFLFETNDQPNLIRSNSTGMNRSFSLRPRGRAHLDHDYAMVLTDGAFLANDVDGEILAACRQTNQLSIEATIRPLLPKQEGPARIVTFSTNVLDRDFTLGQLRDELIVRIRTPQTGPNGVDGVDGGITVCKLDAGKVNHVIVSYKPGTLVCYMNGKQVFEGHQIQGDFGGWSAQHLLFGDEYAGERNWAGSLEGVAIYNRFLEPQEAGRNALQYEHLRQSRRVVQQVKILGELTAKSVIPTPAQIQPHRSALVVCKYRVKKVLEGRLDQDWVLVAQWALLDGKEQPIVKHAIGTEATLALEPFDRNPQAQRYLYSDDLTLEDGGERFLEI